MGIFNAGSSLGSLIAPPLVAFLTLRYGWRAAFVFTGALGVVWVVLWLILYQPPHKNPFLRQSEFVKIREQIAPATEAVAAEKVNWVHVVRMRGCWTLILTRFFTDPVIYFVIFWLPQYLRTQRGFDLAAVGKYAFVPFVFGVATHDFVRPSETHVPTLHASLSAVQSLLLVHRTAFTHSEGEELGDCEGYEQTSMSSAPLPTSPILTQHWA